MLVFLRYEMYMYVYIYIYRERELYFQPVYDQTTFHWHTLGYAAGYLEDLSQIQKK